MENAWIFEQQILALSLRKLSMWSQICASIQCYFYYVLCKVTHSKLVGRYISFCAQNGMRYIVHGIMENNKKNEKKRRFLKDNLRFTAATKISRPVSM